MYRCDCLCKLKHEKSRPTRNLPHPKNGRVETNGESPVLPIVRPERGAEGEIQSCSLDNARQEMQPQVRWNGNQGRRTTPLRVPISSRRHGPSCSQKPRQLKSRHNTRIRSPARKGARLPRQSQLMLCGKGVMLRSDLHTHTNCLIAFCGQLSPYVSQYMLLCAISDVRFLQSSTLLFRIMVKLEDSGINSGGAKIFTSTAKSSLRHSSGPEITTSVFSKCSG